MIAFLDDPMMQQTVAPVYNDERVAIYHGDSRSILPLIRPGERWADMFLTDPPYDEKTHDGARTNPNWKMSGGNEGAKLIHFDPVTIEQLRSDFAMMGRAAKGWIASFLDYRHAVYLEDVPPEGVRFVRQGVWIKPNAAPQFSGDRPAQGWERIVVLDGNPEGEEVEGEADWATIALLHKVGGRMQMYQKVVSKAVWTANLAPKPKGRKRHPAEKPVPLLCQLVMQFSPNGGIVVDPFGGSMAVAEAAIRMGRKAVIIERDIEWVEIGIKRLQGLTGVY